jgi:WD40 repeat protein
MRYGRMLTLLTDVDRLLLAYKTPIIAGALHVYFSALATMPSCLLWEETAPHDSHGIPLLVTKRALDWGVRETVMEARSVIMCIAYSPNGKLIASVSWNNLIQVWDVATGTVLHSMSVPDTEAAGEPLHFISAAFSPTGRWIASASDDCTVRLWDVITGSQHHAMRGHTNLVTCVAFSPDGTIIFSGSKDRTLRIWDIDACDARLVLTGHTECVKSLACAPNGQTVVSAANDGTLRVWDVLMGTELRIIEDDEFRLGCVAFSPDGAIIASGSSTETVQLWSATDSTRQHALESHRHCVYSLAFSPDSRSIVSCKKHSLWAKIDPVAYSPDGKSIAIGSTGTIRIRDANASVAAHPILKGDQAAICSVAFSRDGLLIVSGSDDQTVRIWDVITVTERHVMVAEGAVLSTTFSPDGRTIACGQSNGTVQVWDVASGLQQSSMMGRNSVPVFSVAFSSDSKSVVSSSDLDGILVARVWDAATGTEQRILKHTDHINLHLLKPIAFSADDKAIIMRESYDSDVVLGFWDLTKTQPEYTESTSPHERTPTIDDFYTSEQHHFEGRYSAWIRHRVGQEEPTNICWLPGRKCALVDGME